MQRPLPHRNRGRSMTQYDKAIQKALGRALNLISYRQRTESELRRRLAEKAESDVVDAAVERLKEQGLIDDAKYATEWSDSRARRSPRSSRMIVRELVNKGVAPSLAEASVRSVWTTMSPHTTPHPDSRPGSPTRTTNSSTAGCGAIFRGAATLLASPAARYRNSGRNARASRTDSRRPSKELHPRDFTRTLFPTLAIGCIL